MTNFTPYAAAIGGLLIGLAASLLLIATGRISGVSGFVSRLLPPYEDRDWAIRIAFVAGLALAPWIYKVAIGGAALDLDVTGNTSILMGAGLLVGCGAVFAGGCTSGHGVCGNARLSARSLAATATFMSAAMLTVFITHHAGL